MVFFNSLRFSQGGPLQLRGFGAKAQHLGRGELLLVQVFQPLDGLTLQRLGLLKVAAVHFLNLLGMRGARLLAFPFVPGRGPLPALPLVHVFRPGLWDALALSDPALLPLGVDDAKERPARPREAKALEAGVPAVGLFGLLFPRLGYDVVHGLCLVSATCGPQVSITASVATRLGWGCLRQAPCQFGLAPGEVLPALNDDIDIQWVQFHQVGAPAGLLRGNQSGAAAAEQIEDALAAS